MQLPATPALSAALSIASTLRNAGHQAFFAGGCVRDLLLDIAPKDYDVATSATPAEVSALFPRTLEVGAHFGVILVQMDTISIEVATFRHDGAYLDGRRPDAVRFSTSPAEDVQRRDFTVNGMLLDPADNAILDLVGGRDDLARKLVRTIGAPSLRFAEDKLRMLRGIRFAARLGFALEPQTLAAMQTHAAEITQVSNERIRDELTRMLTEGHARRAFELLDQSALLPHILPEVARMHGVQQPPQYHPEGDVWVHTLMLLDHLPAGAPATLAWGMLLHDVGKPATFQPPDPNRPGDRIRFNGHAEVGTRIAEDILNRLRFSNDDIAQILALVRNHMRFGDILEMRQSTLTRFLRLPRFDEHLALHRADCLSSHGKLGLYDFAREHFERAEPEHLRPAPLVTGRSLIAAGYRPSPQFKPMLELAEDAQLEGRIATPEEGLALIREHFAPPPSAAYDVLVLGAGMAGLAAARTLAEAGRRVLLLEASDRVGGRIHTVRAGDEVIELGAEFIHGRPPELWALLEEAGLETYERTGDFLRLEDGNLLPAEDEEEDDSILGALKLYTGPDRSFAAHLDTLDLPPEQRASELGYVEGFNAADAREASILALGRQQAAEDLIDGDRVWRLRAGYNRLPEFLRIRAEAAGTRILFVSRVTRITRQPGKVRVEDDQHRTFEAPKLIVALPLGVLQSGAIAFDPPPPQLDLEALAMGDVCRFTLVFSRPLWPEGMSFLLTPDLLPSVWWTAHPASTHTLTGWVGGPRSRPLLALPEAELQQVALASAARAFNLPLEEVEAALLTFHTLNWTAADTARGAYSWVCVGGLEASTTWSQPVENTLFFAGEHTDTTGHWGTVHAAYRSGLRAASQVLAK